MEAPTTPEEAVEQAALGPRRVQVANESVEQYDIDQLIKAANFVATPEVAAKPHFGLRFTQLVPPGCG